MFDGPKVRPQLGVKLLVFYADITLVTSLLSPDQSGFLMSNVLTSNRRNAPASLPHLPAKAPEYFKLNERKRPMLTHSYHPVGQIDIYIEVDPKLQGRRPLQMGIDWYKEIYRNKKLMKKAGYSFRTRHSMLSHELVQCPKNRVEYEISLRLAKEWVAKHNALLAELNVPVGNYSAVQDALYQLGVKD
jgi:hypothetical protein